MTTVQAFESETMAPEYARAGTPLLAVVDLDGTLASWVTALGKMFGISVRIAPDAAGLAGALEEETPMGVVCGNLGVEGRHLLRLLKLLSGYDRGMPVLLVTRDDPETLGGVDAALELYPMPDLQRVAGAVRIDAIIAFVAHAARQRGTMRLIAV